MIEPAIARRSPRKAGRAPSRRFIRPAFVLALWITGCALPVQAQACGRAPANSPCARANFIWPAQGRIVESFCGPSDHPALKIALPAASPVRAIAAGAVLYAGRYKTNGLILLIRHPNGFVSLYANLGMVAVKVGARVARGEIVAASAPAPTPLLRFELRKNGAPVDPQRYLACR